jgi:membrane fusion protein, peptide pheromone/bacteriocin exporter
MPILTNFSEIEHSKINFSRTKPSALIFYVILVSFSFCAVTSLFYKKRDISVRAVGIIRPYTERTEIKSLMSGIIETINFAEGSPINKDAVLASIQDNSSIPKKILNDYEFKLRQGFIQDLEILTTSNNINKAILNHLKSPLYRQQIIRLLHQMNEQEAKIQKVSKELEINDTLLRGGVITQVQAAYDAFKDEQQSLWQQDLSRYKLELSQLAAQEKQLVEEAKLHKIYAPISGIIQGINNKYAGGVVQAGETFCIISPETAIIAECYLPTRDAGLIKLGQVVKYQIDAFDYKYFGILSGTVLSIDNDFTVIESKPIFKVRCTFDSTQLHLKNTYAGQLKKGLTFQARFSITERTLWQLLWDNVDDWLNPTAPSLK